MFLNSLALQTVRIINTASPPSHHFAPTPPLPFSHVWTLLFPYWSHSIGYFVLCCPVHFTPHYCITLLKLHSALRWHAISICLPLLCACVCDWMLFFDRMKGAMGLAFWPKWLVHLKCSELLQTSKSSYFKTVIDTDVLSTYCTWAQTFGILLVTNMRPGNVNVYVLG